MIFNVSKNVFKKHGYYHIAAYFSQLFRFNFVQPYCATIHYQIVAKFKSSKSITDNRHTYLLAAAPYKFCLLKSYIFSIISYVLCHYKDVPSSIPSMRWVTLKDLNRSQLNVHTQQTLRLCPYYYIRLTARSPFIDKITVIRIRLFKEHLLEHSLPV